MIAKPKWCQDERPRTGQLYMHYWTDNLICTCKLPVFSLHLKV